MERRSWVLYHARRVWSDPSRRWDVSSHAEDEVVLSRGGARRISRSAFRGTPLEDSALWLRWASGHRMRTSWRGFAAAGRFERPLSRILRFGSDEHYVMVSIPLAHCLLHNAFGATPVEDPAFFMTCAGCDVIKSTCTLHAAGGHFERPLSRILRFG